MPIGSFSDAEISQARMTSTVPTPGLYRPVPARRGSGETADTAVALTLRACFQSRRAFRVVYRWLFVAWDSRLMKLALGRRRPPALTTPSKGTRAVLVIRQAITYQGVSGYSPAGSFSSSLTCEFLDRFRVCCARTKPGEG